jgi:large subunit ribosomal protein L10
LGSTLKDFLLYSSQGGFQEVLCMPKEKKVKIVGDLQENFSKCTIGIMTDYRGMTTTDVNTLRKKLRDAKVEYKVVKNTLAQIAAKNAGLEHTEDLLKGPMAVAFGYGEIPDAAKVLTEFIRTSKSPMKIQGGFLTDRALTVKDIEALAKLPSKAVLISMVMAGMQSPIYGFVNVMAAPIRGLMQVLQGRIQQMEGK